MVLRSRVEKKQRSRVSGHFRVKVLKKDDERMQVFGFAATLAESGQPLEDSHGDEVPVEEFEQAVYQYVRKHRMMGEQHERFNVGELIESVFLNAEKRAALSVPNETDNWWVGYQVTDRGTYDRIKTGERQDFSYGGDAERIPHPTIKGRYRLKDLEIDEVSAVDEGAGHNVRVALVKGANGGKMNKDKILKMLALFAATSSDAAVRVAKCVVAIEKKEINTLAEVEEALTPELYEVVLMALEAAAMQGMSEAPEPAPAPSPEEKKEGDDENEDVVKEDEPAAGGGDDDEEEKANKSLAKMRADMQADREKLAKEKAQLTKLLNDTREEKRVEVAKLRVQKEFPAILGATDSEFAAVLVALERVEKSASAPVIIAPEIAKTLLKVLKMQHDALVESEIMKGHIESRGIEDPEERDRVSKAVTNADAKIRKIASAKMAASKGALKWEAAYVEAVRENPKLYEEHRSEMEGN